VAALFFLLGWALGVVVNALADALPAHRLPGWPRCRACSAPRPRVALSGLVGLLSGAGRCAYCGTARGARPPIVELVLSFGTVALGLAYPVPTRFVSALAISTVFLLIVVTDLEHRLILNAVVLPAAALFAVLGALDPARGLVKTLTGGLVGFVAFYLLYVLGGLFGRAASRLRGKPLTEVPFGFGDVSLAGLIGLVLGWPGVVVGLLLGIFAAGAFSLLYMGWMAIRRRYSAFTAFPYGPFMVLGGLAVYFRVWNVFDT
jgi:leader peptidase (prepilin peptidase)/N-methyltransferase